MEIARDGSILTFYVDVKNQVTLVCPQCHAQKSIDASNYKSVKTALKVNCPCGETFSCNFEFRKHYRKKVKLPGEFVNTKTGERGTIMVEDISIEGVGFSTDELTDIKPGVILTIHFTLDNKSETTVERTIKVTSVRHHSVGAMFFGSARNKTVGFYLMP